MASCHRGTCEERRQRSLIGCIDAGGRRGNGPVLINTGARNPPRDNSRDLRLLFVGIDDCTTIEDYIHGCTSVHRKQSLCRKLTEAFIRKSKTAIRCIWGLSTRMAQAPLPYWSGLRAAQGRDAKFEFINMTYLRWHERCAPHHKTGVILDGFAPCRTPTLARGGRCAPCYKQPGHSQRKSSQSTPCILEDLRRMSRDQSAMQRLKRRSPSLGERFGKFVHFHALKVTQH